MSRQWTSASYGKSEYTPIKQVHLREIAMMVVCAARKVQDKHPWAYERLLCADLMAGPGLDDDGDAGSPCILLDTVRAHAAQAQLWFCEDNRERGQRLLQVMSPQQGSSSFPVEVCLEDCRRAFPRYLDTLGQTWPLERVFGLIYADPTTEAPWETLAYAARALRRVDILISLPACTIKRVVGTHGPSGAHLPLPAGMGMVQKDVWLIRELVGRHQWTFLLGTNYPDMHECKRIGLVRLDSPHGQRIWDRACLTAEQMQQQTMAAQPPLFASEQMPLF